MIFLLLFVFSLIFGNYSTQTSNVSQPLFLSSSGFNATLDQPSCFVYQQLLEYYPEAKVLNTQRDATSWARSMVEMAYSLDLYSWQPPYNGSWNVSKGPFGYWAKKNLGYRDEEIFPRGVPANSSSPYDHLERKSSMKIQSVEAAYQRYQDQVRANVPEDKLIAFHPKEGWAPLCQHFLPPERSCPDNQPFPRVNSREDGFLLDYRRIASAKVNLYKIHPALSKQEWLVKIIAYSMKQRRRIISFFQRTFQSQKQAT